MALWKKNISGQGDPPWSIAKKSPTKYKLKTYIPNYIPTFELSGPTINAEFPLYTNDKFEVEAERISNAFKNKYVPTKENIYYENPSFDGFYYNGKYIQGSKATPGPLKEYYDIWKKGGYALLKNRPYQLSKDYGTPINNDLYKYGSEGRKSENYESSLFTFKDKMDVLNRFYNPKFLNIIGKDSIDIDSLMKRMIDDNVFIETGKDKNTKGKTSTKLGTIWLDSRLPKNEMHSTYAHEVVHNLLTPDSRNIKPKDSIKIMNYLKNNFKLQKNKDILNDKYWGNSGEIGARLISSYLYPKSYDEQMKEYK